MLCATMPSNLPVSTEASLISGVARCWRRAKDDAAPRQQHLYAYLETHGLGLLAPVFDGLLSTFEAAKGRRFGAGQGEQLSGDESRLLALLAGRIAAGPLGSPDLASTLQVALESTRRMMTLVRAPAELPDQTITGRPLLFQEASQTGEGHPLMACVLA